MIIRNNGYAPEKLPSPAARPRTVMFALRNHFVALICVVRTRPLTSCPLFSKNSIRAPRPCRCKTCTIPPLLSEITDAEIFSSWQGLGVGQVPAGGFCCGESGQALLRVRFQTFFPSLISELTRRDRFCRLLDAIESPDRAIPLNLNQIVGNNATPCSNLWSL